MGYTSAFIEAVTRHYVPDAELRFAGSRGEGGLGDRASDVRWDDANKSWLIRLDPRRREHWLHDALHEVAHVLLGHVAKEPPDEWRRFEELATKIVDGELAEDEALAHLKEARRLSWEIREQQESEADAWAAREAEKYRAVFWHFLICDEAERLAGR